MSKPIKQGTQNCLAPRSRNWTSIIFSPVWLWQKIIPLEASQQHDSPILSALCSQCIFILCQFYAVEENMLNHRWLDRTGNPVQIFHETCGSWPLHLVFLLTWARPRFLGYAQEDTQHSRMWNVFRYLTAFMMQAKEWKSQWMFHSQKPKSMAAQESSRVEPPDSMLQQTSIILWTPDSSAGYNEVQTNPNQLSHWYCGWSGSKRLVPSANLFNVDLWIGASCWKQSLQVVTCKTCYTWNICWLASLRDGRLVCLIWWLGHW